jgi:PAS domain S-box-containing protein
MDTEIASHDFTFDGRAARMVVAIDVTRRTRAENALRASEERYRKIVDLSPDAITIHMGGRFVFANAAAARLLGVDDPAQLTGRSLLDFMHPDMHEQVQERWKRLYEEREPVEPTDLKMTRPDGSVVYLETRAVPLDWEGQPAAQMVARDTT